MLSAFLIFESASCNSRFFTTFLPNTYNNVNAIETSMENGEKIIDELEELARKLNFAAIKNKFWGRANSIKELKLRKITWKKKWDREIRNRNKRDGTVRNRDDSK